MNNNNNKNNKNNKNFKKKETKLKNELQEIKQVIFKIIIEKYNIFIGTRRKRKRNFRI